jgi:hypothetical protein
VLGPGTSHPRRVMSKAQVETSRDVVPADFIVTHGSGLEDALIRFMTRSRWNHAALIAGADGTIIEATGRGIKRDNIRKYRRRDYYLVRLEMEADDRAEAVAYANAMADRHERYGYLTIFAIVLRIVTRLRLVIKVDGTLICSEFVARSLSQGGRIWYKDTSLITPADLYNVCVLGASQD